MKRLGGGDYVSSFLLYFSNYLRIKHVVKYMNMLGEVLEGLYDPLERVTTRAEILIHDGAVIHKPGAVVCKLGVR